MSWRVGTVGLMVAALLLGAGTSAHAITVAVFGDNDIDDYINATFGAGSATLVSDADLATPGFLDAYNALVYTRDNAFFGGGLSPAAQANVMAYVGLTGNVALFASDWADMVGPSSGDPIDANVQLLVSNAVAWADSSGNGLVGEFNGACNSMSAGPSDLDPAVALIVGSCDVLDFFDDAVDTVSATQPGHPVLAGATFPFDPAETTTFRAWISGADAANVAAVWADGYPAILVRGGVEVPEAGSLLLLATGLMGLAKRRRLIGAIA